MLSTVVGPWGLWPPCRVELGASRDPLAWANEHPVTHFLSCAAGRWRNCRSSRRTRQSRSLGKEGLSEWGWGTLRRTGSGQVCASPPPRLSRCGLSLHILPLGCSSLLQLPTRGQEPGWLSPFQNPLPWLGQHTELSSDSQSCRAVPRALRVTRSSADREEISHRLVFLLETPVS